MLRIIKRSLKYIEIIIEVTLLLTTTYLVAPRGFEPLTQEPKSCVLPSILWGKMSLIRGTTTKTIQKDTMSRWEDLNLRPLVPKTSMLPTAPHLDFLAKVNRIFYICKKNLKFFLLQSKQGKKISPPNLLSRFNGSVFSYHIFPVWTNALITGSHKTHICLVLYSVIPMTHYSIKSSVS